MQDREGSAGARERGGDRDCAGTREGRTSGCRHREGPDHDGRLDGINGFTTAKATV